MKIRILSAAQHELEILRLLARAEKEIEADVGFDLASVLSEADALLANQP
jgi:hypothetical protein